MSFGGAGGGWPVEEEAEDPRAIAQVGAHDCGCACVQIVLRELAIPPPHPTQPAVAELGGGTPFTIESVRLVLSGLDKLNAAKWRAGSVELTASMVHRLRSRGAWIALLWEPRQKIGHFVVVVDIQESGTRCFVEILDPAHPGTRYTMTCNAFFETWTTFCVFRDQ